MAPKEKAAGMLATPATAIKNSIDRAFLIVAGLSCDVAFVAGVIAIVMVILKSGGSHA